MKAATRAPRTLYAQCEQHANEVHSRRLAELAGLAPLLARMDEVMPTLKKHGLELHPDLLGLARRFSGTTTVNMLRISTYWLHGPQAVGKWLQALLDAGFKPVSVDKPGSAYPLAVLKRGHLRVCINVTEADAANLHQQLAPLKAAA